MHTFIIEYKDDSVRVDVASHSELEEKIRGLFKVSNFKLKIKDPEFDYFRNLNSRFVRDLKLKEASFFRYDSSPLFSTV